MEKAMRNKRDGEMRRLQDFNRDLKGEGPSMSPSLWALSIPGCFRGKPGFAGQNPVFKL